MAAARVCSECGKPLEGKGPAAKTCSVSCRQKRARRRKKANDEAQQVEGAVASTVVREAEGVITRIMNQELTPVVREAIDEDVLRAIQKLVGLTTAAVDAIQKDLDSEDPVMRQRAAALVVKYTVGHPALVKPSDEKHEPMQVIFNLPRPDDPASDQDPVPRDAEVVEETRVCDICGQEKLISEFVAGSERCQSCFAEWRDRILQSLA